LTDLIEVLRDEVDDLSRVTLYNQGIHTQDTGMANYMPEYVDYGVDKKLAESSLGQPPNGQNHQTNQSMAPQQSNIPQNGTQNTFLQESLLAAQKNLRKTDENDTLKIANNENNAKQTGNEQSRMQVSGLGMENRAGPPTGQQSLVNSTMNYSSMGGRDRFDLNKPSLPKPQISVSGSGMSKREREKFEDLKKNFDEFKLLLQGFPKEFSEFKSRFELMKRCSIR
jgi:hypothetical protein